MIYPDEFTETHTHANGHTMEIKGWRIPAFEPTINMQGPYWEAYIRNRHRDDNTFVAWACDHKYQAKTKDAVIAKALNDPRNDPKSMYRSSSELTEVRTVHSRAVSAIRFLIHFHGTDPDATAIQADLEKVVSILRKWERPK